MEIEIETFSFYGDNGRVISREDKLNCKYEVVCQHAYSLALSACAENTKED